MKTICKTISTFFLLPVLTFYSFGQAPPIAWQNTIGGSLYEHFYSIVQTSDGGYFLGGTSSSNISGDKTENCMGSFGLYDYWVVKLDGSGNIQWENTIGGNAEDELTSVIQTSDGGYFIGGYSYSDSSGDKTANTLSAGDFWVVKLNSAGTIQWDKTIELGGDDRLYTVQQSPDGGFLVAGSVANQNYILLKLDSAGNFLWQKIVNQDWHANLRSFDQTTDGGYILGGDSDGGIGYDKTEPCFGFLDFWVVKLDSLRNIQWQNTIGGNDYDYLHSIQQTNDGGYILGGFSDSGISGDKTEITIGASDYWVVKLNSIGSIQWQNTIQASGTDYAYAIEQTLDSGYILCGHTQSGAGYDKTQNLVGGDDFWVLKLDVNGNIEWDKNIGGSSHDDGATSIHQTLDGGYIFGGWSFSDISGDKTENSNGVYDYWIIKLLPDTITSIPILQSSPSTFQIFPNPATTIIQLTISTKHNAPLECEIINIMGERVYEAPLPASPRGGEGSYAVLNVPFLEKGIYLVRVGDGARWENKKLVIE